MSTERHPLDPRSPQFREIMQRIIERRFYRYQYKKFGGVSVPSSATIAYSHGVDSLSARWQYRDEESSEHVLHFRYDGDRRANTGTARFIGSVLARKLIQRFPDLQKAQQFD